jgi:hypothetical protein
MIIQVSLHPVSLPFIDMLIKDSGDPLNTALVIHSRVKFHGVIVQDELWVTQIIIEGLPSLFLARNVIYIQPY